MKMLILTICLCASVFAQLPLSQQARADGAILGNAAIFRIAQNHDRPEDRQPVHVRLAGLSAPESTGGGVTESLTNASTNALSYLLSEQLAHVEIVGMERVTVEVEGVQREIVRYIAFVTILHQTLVPLTDQSQFEWRDVGAEMVRNGFAYIDRVYARELEGRAEQRQYADLQAEATQIKRGIWTHPYLFRGIPVERPPMPGRAAPKRGATRN